MLFRSAITSSLGNVGKTEITPSRSSPHRHIDSIARLSCSFITTPIILLHLPIRFAHMFYYKYFFPVCNCFFINAINTSASPFLRFEYLFHLEISQNFFPTFIDTKAVHRYNEQQTESTHVTVNDKKCLAARNRLTGCHKETMP